MRKLNHNSSDRFSFNLILNNFRVRITIATRRTITRMNKKPRTIQTIVKFVMTECHEYCNFPIKRQLIFGLSTELNFLLNDMHERRKCDNHKWTMSFKNDFLLSNTIFDCFFHLNDRSNNNSQACKKINPASNLHHLHKLFSRRKWNINVTVLLRSWTMNSSL